MPSNDIDKLFEDNAPPNVIDPDLQSSWGKLWRIFSTELAVLDKALYDITNINIVQLMGGVNLDNIGDKIGLDRRGVDDPDYRLLLEINKADESIDRDYIITLLFRLLNADEFRLEPAFPAGVEVRVTNPDPIISIEDVAFVLSLLWKFARRYIVIQEVGTDTFSFFDGDGKGFDDSDSPDQANAGKLAWIIADS